MTEAAPLIMVVEDAADISDAMAATLEDRGYGVLLAANGREALDTLLASASLPRLILLDLMMPVMDGSQFPAAQKTEPKLAGLPVVLLSAHADVRQGRAEDILPAASDAIVLRIGYRTVEGGAANDEVYNFTWLRYGAAGALLRL